MIQSFRSFINNESLFNENDRILLAVSGGVDSMVMAELFDNSSYQFAIAHCNFHLRGKESDDDAKFVENLARKKNVPFYLKNFDTKDYAAIHKISIQMAARQLRFSWFDDLLKDFGFSYYATAHQQDDQIETFFINLIRGCGISGLHGILPKQGKLIHPMLFTNRRNIENFANQNEIVYRTDSSNIRSDYTRNKIRNVLLPIINEINPEYISTFTGNIERLCQVEMIYNQQINHLRENLITENDNQVRISIHRLQELEAKETLLFELISPYGFNISDVKNILDVLPKPSGRIFLSKSHKLYKDRKYLIIEPEMSQITERKEYFIPQGVSEIVDPIRLKLTYCEMHPEFRFAHDNMIASLDADKVSFPLKLRRWEKGDYFYPLGMENKKLLSDFFIDQKLSIPEKEKIWIITSGDQILWIIGGRIDNRFRITSSTRNIIRIQQFD